MAKIVWISVIIAGFICEGFCAKYEFGDRVNKSCILLDIDASFELRYIDGNTTKTSPVFNLDGSSVVLNESLCGSPFQDSIVLTVKLFPSRENLVFTFVKAKNDTVHRMRVQFYLSPAEHFNDINDTEIEEMSGINDLDVGMISNTSYLCRSEQQIFFVQNQPFYMTMNITNLQFQASDTGIAKNTFGPAVECAKDQTTTVLPDTTEHDETTVPHTATTEFTTVTSHTQGTTNHSTEITFEPNSTTTVEPMTNATEPHNETTVNPHNETTVNPHNETTVNPITETTNTPHTETTEVTSTSSPKGSNSGLAIGLGAGFGGLFVLIIVAGLLCRYKNKRERSQRYEELK